jgi:uncharacterized protein YcbX
MAIELSGIHVYPLKGAGGLAPGAWRAGRRGFDHDRRWMAVDSGGRFLSQRTLPRLALIRVAVTGDGALNMAAPRMPALSVDALGAGAAGSPMAPPGSPLPVLIWHDWVEARDAGPAAAAWLSRFLGIGARLVDPRYAAPGDRVGLADAFPYLLVSEASLADLNARLAEPLPMNRFRPNLVVSGCAPYAEDGWRRIRIGALEFRVVKPCARCVVTTTDQATGRRGAEPLRTLATYRQRDGGIMFGQNLIPDGEGDLRMGDAVEVLA